jgi:signal transduction histidine kinase
LEFEEHSPSQALNVMGDVHALRRVIDVLLDNAFKYTPPPGRISVTAEQNNGCAAVIVQDSGEGIPAADQARIFERFYRVDKARSRALGGAGLGLAIAQWIVQLHKGSIAVNSKPGAGSTFRVEIPLASTVAAVASNSK